MTTDIELLPCPFCGGRPYMQSDSDVDGCYWSKVRCSSCDVATRGKWASSSANTCPQWYAEVREEWNTRANVTHATAAKDAEIERLRAEREVIVAEAVKYADKSGRLEAKAERLAEALRRAEGLLRSAGIIAESDLERPHSAATEIKNALRDHDQEGKDG